MGRMSDLEISLKEMIDFRIQELGYADPKDDIICTCLYLLPELADQYEWAKEDEE